MVLTGNRSSLGKANLRSITQLSFSKLYPTWTHPLNYWDIT